MERDSIDSTHTNGSAVNYCAVCKVCIRHNARFLNNGCHDPFLRTLLCVCTVKYRVNTNLETSSCVTTLNDICVVFSQGNNYQIELNKVNGSFGFNVMVSIMC